MNTDLLTERKIAVMQLRQGKTIAEVAKMLNRSPSWVCKWKQRYATKSWTGLKDKSRAPLKHGNQLSETTRQAICQTRLELEAEAELGTGLKYIGGQAIRTRLKQKQVSPLPSIPTIERVISAARLTQPKSQPIEPKIVYPRLHPTQPHQLCQVDIVPHFLQGGQRIACFNAIDTVSRYPTGLAYEQRRSQDAAEFLIHVWQELSIPKYTQVDNEGCFSGGATHSHVLGKVVRLALMVGTELVFSPIYHPKSNGHVERFHQDYNQHVWQDTYLSDLAAVNQQGKVFFPLYRQREDHSQLHGQSPVARHYQQQPQNLTADFKMPAQKLPLYQGRIHFMRQVLSDGTVRVLNANWVVPKFDPTKGVWVTIEFKIDGTMLSIYDEAPDNINRHCLATYPFPLQEPLEAPKIAEPECETLPQQLPLPPVEDEAIPDKHHRPESRLSFYRIVKVGGYVVLSSIEHTARLARHVKFTMY